MINSYIQILQDSLVKKLELLTRIEEKSLEQSRMLKSRDVDLTLVDFNMDEKATLINEILALDDGFEVLYEKIRVHLVPNK